jgi:NTE family protein
MRSNRFAGPEALMGEPAGTTPAGDGLALCLSGGGYRAMVFHVGVLWRLNEAGLLPTLTLVSSVSGGSITAGVLAMNWADLAFAESGVAPADRFCTAVVDPVRAMAGQNVDITSVLAGLGLPFVSIADRVVTAYRQHLFGTKTLQDLLDDPYFVFNATNLETADLMRFSKPYLGDYRVGRVLSPDLPLAVAVGASSAFPPFLSPCTVDLAHEEWVTDDGNMPDPAGFRTQIQLADGGVYDNLALQAAQSHSRLFVSDAGAHIPDDATPARDWPLQMLRVLDVIDNQVRSLRKRGLIADFEANRRSGMYVGIRSHVADFALSDPIPADPHVTEELAAIPTRLDRLDETQQELLINWGYAICDTGLRAHVTPGSPGTLPYPDRPLT